MLKYKANMTTLVMRVNDFGEYSFIEEHLSKLKEKGYVFILKAGRPLATKSIQTVIEDGGQLIIKPPKKSGGKYYACHVLTISQEEPDNHSGFPNYYGSLKKAGISMNGTWIKVDNLVEISTEAIPHFTLIKGGKLMSEIINSTRSPILFVHADVDMKEVNGKLVVEE